MEQIALEVELPAITQIAAQKKNNERVSVFVDGDFFCGLAIDDVVKNSLVVGMEVDEAFLSNLLIAAGENDMFNKTLVYILRSPRTESEIRRYLSRKRDCSPEMITRIVERLKTMNYINDEAYARMFVGAKHVKISERAIKQKLRGRGVDSDIVDKAASEIGDQSELAADVAAKYMRYKEYDEKNLQRLFRYLLSKGFEYDDVGEIVKSYKEMREVDPEMKEEYINSREEYQKAKALLRQAWTEARQQKKKYKEIKKKIITDMQ